MSQGLGVTQAVLDAIIAHATTCAPDEACGLLGGSGGTVTRFVPVTNAAQSTTNFELDGAGMLAAETAIERSGDDVVGVMHSHPATEAWPSPTDLRDAAVYDPSAQFVHLIVSLAADRPVVRAFRLDGMEPARELTIR